MNLETTSAALTMDNMRTQNQAEYYNATGGGMGMVSNTGYNMNTAGLASGTFGPAALGVAGGNMATSVGFGTANTATNAAQMTVGYRY